MESARPKVNTLADLVVSQPGSIVSKMLLKKPAGTVTLFAFGAGEGLSEHTAPYEAIVYLVEGQAEVDIAGEPYVLVQGDTITLPANVPHAVRATHDFKMLLIMIKA